MWSSSRSRLWRIHLALLLTTILVTTAVVNYSLSLSHSANTHSRGDLVQSSGQEAHHLRVLERDFILTQGSGSGLSDLESSKRVLSERFSSLQTPSSSAAGRGQGLTTAQANAEPNDDAKQVVFPSIQAIQSSASFQDREGENIEAQSLGKSAGDGLQRETESLVTASAGDGLQRETESLVTASQKIEEDFAKWIPSAGDQIARNEVSRSFVNEEAGGYGTGRDYVNGGRVGSSDTSEEEKRKKQEAQESLPIANGRGESVVYFLQNIKREIDAWASVISATQAGAFQRWRTCAVVGNGGRLIGSGHGAFIDSHTMVMRMNNAPVKGFEVDVGRKTTISFINGHRFHACAGQKGCACFSYGDDVAIATYPCAEEHDGDVRVCQRERPGSLIFVMDRGFRDLCNRIVGTYHARGLAGLSLEQRRQKRRDRASQRMHFSSGMQGVTFFSVLCEQVSLFGFGSGGNSHHYFENKTQHEFPDHDYEAESRFYGDLANRQWSNVPFVESLGGQLANLEIYQ